MAKVRVKNMLDTSLSIPGMINTIIPAKAVKEFDVIDLDFVFNDKRIDFLVKRGAVELQRVEDDTPPGSPLLPFYATGDMPSAAVNAGMMLYNTTDNIVLYSDGVVWLALETIPIYSGGLPAPASLPASYLIFDKDSQTLWVNSGSQWMLTMAAGVQAVPSHLFPTPASRPIGSLRFDSDNQQLKINDGANWRLINNVNDYSTEASLPPVASVGQGALAYTGNDGTLWIRKAAAWVPAVGHLQYYEDFADLPATYGNDQTGVIAYVNEFRAIAIWDGKYWIWDNHSPVYKTIDLPAPANSAEGYTVIDGSIITTLVSFGGNWEYPTPVARSFAAISRPLLASVPVGFMVFNTTSGKPNWSNGVAWVDGVGTIDP